VAHRLIAEAIDEAGLINKMTGVAPVGCSVFAYKFFNFDMAQAAHGRAPAVATGMKRARPDMHVFTYQGDGDLAAIGTAEIVHAANRGEHISVFFVNNAIYGMTGGQMAPTTMLNQKTTTSPTGRKQLLDGYPVKVSEIFSKIGGATYIERCSVSSPLNVNKTKKAIRKAFQCQLDGLGFSMVEVLSMCPTNWKMSSVDSCKWIDDVLGKEFPPGVYKDEIASLQKAAEAQS